MGAHWRYLTNMTEPSVYGGDTALCQISLTFRSNWLTVYGRAYPAVFRSFVRVCPDQTAQPIELISDMVDIVQYLYVVDLVAHVSRTRRTNLGWQGSSPSPINFT